MKITAAARALHNTLKEQGVGLRVKDGRLLVKPSDSPIQPGLREAVKRYEEQIVFLLSEETPAHAPVFTCPECGGNQSRRFWRMEVCSTCVPDYSPEELRRHKRGGAQQLAAIQGDPHDEDDLTEAELIVKAYGAAEEAYAILRDAGVVFTVDRMGRLLWDTMEGAPAADVEALAAAHGGAFIELHRKEEQRSDRAA